MPHVKIFGERNTGTNVLHRLIENNSECRLAPGIAFQLDDTLVNDLHAIVKTRNKNPKLIAHEYESRIDQVFENQPAINMWKHAATDFQDIRSLKNTKVIFCVRHPMSWIVSFHKRPYNKKLVAPSSLEAFSKIWVPLLRRDNLNYNSLRPLELYSRKLKSYLDFARQLDGIHVPNKFIKHEDITIKQESVIQELSSWLNFKTRNPYNASTKDPSKNRAFYKSYYENELWKEPIEGSWSALGNELDKALFEKLEYQV
ncbi:hypothetical protein [Ruegeria atlantica]|uniref:hypothetical protein n=1 Tax=Ruegeria atlantica TaxID=81569 RepID=UPI0014810FC4|nr:hypothetical protein [Ruegeria atlantica]